MVAVVWTLVGLMATGLVASIVDARSGRRELRAELRGEMAGLRTEMKGEMAGLRTELRTELGELRREVHGLAERQAEMNGRLDLVAAQAHTHPPAAAPS